jgi:hypothetical protein
MIAINSWDDFPDLEGKLWEAGMRYAVLVGIVDPFDQVSPYVAADTAKYGFMRHSEEGLPIFDETDAAKFISEIAGVSEEVAFEWIEHDWVVPEGEIGADKPSIVLH